MKALGYSLLVLLPLAAACGRLETGRAEISFILETDAPTKAMSGGTTSFLLSDGFLVSAKRSALSGGSSGWLWNGVPVSYNPSTGRFPMAGYYWPESSSEALDFYAVSPRFLSLAFDEGRPFLSFGTDFHASSGNCDPLVAEALEVFPDNAGIPLEFSHICSCIEGVGFRVSSPLPEGTCYRVSSVTATLPCGARYYPRTRDKAAEWTEGTASASVILVGSGEGPVVSDAYEATPPCGRQTAVLPCGSVGIRVDWDIIKSDVVIGASSAESQLEMAGGRKYMLTAVLPSGMDAPFSISVEGWKETGEVYEDF